MSAILTTRCHRLADSLAELKLKVRAALATELAGAVGTAVRDVLVVALVDRLVAPARTAPVRTAPPRPASWRDDEDDRERDQWGYRERAAALAVRRAATAGPVGGLRVLVFELAGERYGLDFRDAIELLPFAGCTPVPGGPPELLGVINVRGEIRSVLDLGRLLGLPVGAARGYVLIARGAGETAAFRVDRVEAVHPLAGAVTSPDAIAPFVRGLTADRVRLLDLAAVFAHPVLRPAPAPRSVEGVPSP